MAPGKTPVNDGREPYDELSIPYAIVPGVLVLVDGSAADRAAGKAVRFELPGKV